MAAHTYGTTSCSRRQRESTPVGAVLVVDESNIDSFRPRGTAANVPSNGNHPEAEADEKLVGRGGHCSPIASQADALACSESRDVLLYLWN
jgi:hypothetical protein